MKYYLKKRGIIPATQLFDDSPYIKLGEENGEWLITSNRLSC